LAESDPAQKLQTIERRLNRLERICADLLAHKIREEQAQKRGKVPEPQVALPSVPMTYSIEPDLPQKAKSAIALHSYLSERPLVYLVLAFFSLLWASPLILDKMIASSGKAAQIAQLIPRGKPVAEGENKKLRSKLSEIRSQSNSTIAYLGEYYADREQGAIRLSIHAWDSSEPQPPVILPSPDAFEANAAGECYWEKGNPELGVTAQVSCPILKPGKLYAIVLGFLDAPKDRQGVVDAVGAAGLPL
jgi:hypothetical protein